jgi:predicted PurR-regulated permease PerM
MPVILGSKVRINALIIIIGVIIGEMIWGISGMFVAIPIIAIMKIISDNVESLEPWAILLGDEEKDMSKKKSILTRLKQRMIMLRQKTKV